MRQTEIISLLPGEEYIRLDDAIKSAGFTETGGQAKVIIQAGKVLLNGEVCTMRGKKLRSGDRAEYEGSVLEVR